MNKQIVNHPEMMLLGITARTNNQNEMNPVTAKILPTIQHYFQNRLADKIPNRNKPNVTYCAYTDYDSNEFGDYTYFVGEVVNMLESIPEGLTKLVIPAQQYVKFTNGPGAMPAVCIDAWKSIWQMSPTELGGDRAYISDFEVYDERAMDYQRTELDIYIGIK